jgi:hypothetical protein
VRAPLPRGVLQSSDRHLARAVFLLLLAVYGATFSGAPAVPDGEVVFQTTSALWREGSLALGGTPEAEALIAEAERAPPGGFSVRRGEGERAGSHYGWYGIGQPLLALPLYAAGKLLARAFPDIQAAHTGHTRYGAGRSEYFEHLAFGARNALLTALLGGLLVLVARRLELGRAPALLCGLGYGLGTFAWPQARDSLGDVQGTFLLFVGFHLLLLLQRRASGSRAVLFGIALGLTFLTRAVLAPAVIVLDLALVWQLRGGPSDRGSAQGSGKLVLLAGLPQVVALLAWMAVNQWRFGHTLDSGYGLALAGGLFGGSPFTALFGLMVSPGKGLLWMAPGLLLLGRGVGRARKDKQGALVALVVGVSVAVLLPVLFLRGWHGAYTFGPRYILPALPFLWLLAAWGFQRSPVDERLHPVALGLVAVGLLIQLPSALVDTVTYHDLAVRAAAERFEAGPEDGVGEADEGELALRRFEAMQFDWGFAAPWVHWRILRHRVALKDDDFEAADLFLYPSQLALSPAQPRERGFRHLAWVDLEGRLGGVLWPVVVLIVLLGALGAIEAIRGLDP